MRKLLCLTCLVISLICPTSLLAKKQLSVELALFYRLVHHIKWKEKADSKKYIVSIVGTPKFIEYFNEELSDKTISDKPIEIKSFSSYSPAILLSDFIYITDAYDEILVEIGPDKTKALIVSNRIEDLGKSTICFLIENEMVHFSINIKDAQRRDIVVDPKVIKLAHNVITD